MRRPFIFFSNTFDSATRTSYARMLSISTYTYNALNGPNGIPSLFTQYKTVHEAYVLCYNKWKAQRGMQKGKTASLTDLFKTLVANVGDWDLAVQHVYSRNSPEYIALFPNGRKAFTSGTQDERINAIAQFSIAIGTDPLLTSIKANVDADYAALLTQNSVQKAEKVLTDTKSQELEGARMAACEELYSILGALMGIYKKAPLEIEKFFRMDLLRRMPQTEFTGRVPALTTKEIAKRTFKPETMLGMDNIGLIEWDAFLAATPGGPVPVGTTPVKVGAGESRHISISELGDINNKYLTIRNASELVEAEFEIAVYA